jgi:hypothetical protein
VYTAEELKQIEAALKKRVSKVIRLNYLNANDAAEFVKDLLSKDGGQIKFNAAAKPGSEKPAFTSEEYALSSTLVVIDYEENIEAIEKLVRELDTKPAQVLVEATIVQAGLTEDNAFGVDFSVIGDLNFSDFLNVGGPLGAANALTRGGSGATGQGLSPSDNQGTAVTSNPGNTTGPSTFKLGVISDDISIFLRALDEVTDTTILSNPKILALNRQPARVLVGRRVGYLSTTSSETSTTQTVEFLDTGTQLYFRPFVSDAGEIRLELKPQVSEAEIRDVTDATGAVVTIPDEVTQELTTNVNVKDGQTIVLGGLFRESTSFTRRQVPFLGDLPIVGAAFRGNDDSTTRSEIIFLITPSIVADSMLADAAQRAEDDIVRIRAGTRQGLLPWSRERMTSAMNVEAEKLAREGKSQEALYRIQRSLALNPIQPDAFRLRERILGEAEIWPDRSMLNEVIRGETNRRYQEFQPQGGLDYSVPDKHRNLPRQPINGGPTTGATNSTTGASTQTSLNSSSTVEGAAMPEYVTVTGSPMPELSLPELQASESIRTLIPALRGQIQLFAAMNNGQRPQLGNVEGAGWTALIEKQMLPFAPANSYVGGPNSTKVVIGQGPDASFQTSYGWIYNPETGQLWAAGFNSSDVPFARANGYTLETSPLGVPHTAQNFDTSWSNWMDGLIPAEFLQTLRAMAPVQNAKEQPVITGVETENEGK